MHKFAKESVIKPQQQFKGIWWNVLNLGRERPEGAGIIADKVVALIAEYNLDWVCLQESFRADSHGPGGDLHNIITRITGWHEVFLAGEQRLHGGADYAEGLSTFSRWPIEATNTVTLGFVPPPHPHESELHILEAVLQTHLGQITVANTHWLWPGLSRARSRGEQMRIFKAHIQSIAPDTNYIVGGDFNTMPIHPIINRLGRLLDLRTGNIFSPTWKYNGRKSAIARANIDYVATLLGSRLSISELQVLDRYPSDHAPLLATICMLAQDPTR